jgi:hypothetical protein
MGTAARLEAPITVDGVEQWVKLSCPLSAEDFCGEYCAWYAEEMVGGALGVPVQVVVSCQGHPIGALVTADTGVDHG